jgi:dipeptidyl-peptidase-4
MTTNKRVIYAWIDGRGSAYKGSKMLFEIYRNIGTVEVEDTIAVTA